MIGDGFKLTLKQRQFCHEVVLDWKITRSAIAAGYSERSAYAVGSDNMKKHEIQRYIAHIQKDLSKLSGITSLRILRELEKVAFSSIAHLHNTWIERKDFEALTEDQKASIESIDTKIEKSKKKIKGSEVMVVVHYVKIKLYSKLAAIQEMNKMLGTNAPEQIVNTNINLNSGPLTKEELKQAAEDLDSEL